MDSGMQVTFLALVLVQIAHSAEEYVFRFYAVFPPARLLEELSPGLARPGFVVLNTLLAVFGLWCFFSSVRPGTRSARDWMWIWVAVELFNGVAHPVWAVAARGYVPGLVTSTLLLALATHLFWRLRTTPEPSEP
jgi:hypothetical protein